ncbi:MAG: hypothetical protein AB8C84_02570 [Oligoflexales bacterium]
MIKKSIFMNFLFANLLLGQNVIEIPAPIEKIFSIEKGFDNNDNVEVLISGYLPDTCHKLGRTTVNVDHENKHIQINATAFFQQDKSCLQIRTPYLETINIGLLAAGSYSIDVVGQNIFQSQLKIDTSYHSQQDDQLYAPVQSLSLEPGQSTVLLQGSYPNVLEGCMVIEKIETYKMDNILVILPIAAITKDENICNRDDKMFSLHVDIDDELKNNNGLVYIRTASGRSKSLLVN